MLITMYLFIKGGGKRDEHRQSKSPSGHIIPSLQLLTLMTFSTFDLTFAQCPSQCSCVSFGAGQAVSCGPGLKSFPTLVPADTLVFSLSALPGQTQNNIQSLSQNDFAQFPKVKRITIAASNLQLIDANTFLKFSDLQTLNLKGNRLGNLSRPVLQGLNKLDSLDLTDNFGCHIDSDTFDDLSSLSTLRLAGIGLTSAGNLLSKLRSLKTVDLHGNRLVRLDTGSFAHLSNLRHLDVSFNNLHEIQPGMKSVLSGLTDLRLDYNPWRCNCALRWAKHLPVKFVHPSFGYGAGIICDQPARFQFQDLRNVKEIDMTCIPARIDSCSKAVVVKEGDPVNVTCKIVGDPFPDVVWSRPDTSQYSYTLQSNVTSYTTVSISVTDFSRHDGKWKIHVFNLNGSDTKTLEIDIITTTTATTTPTTTKTTTTTATTTPTTMTPTMITTTPTTTTTSRATTAATTWYSMLSATSSSATSSSSPLNQIHPGSSVSTIPHQGQLPGNLKTLPPGLGPGAFPVGYQLPASSTTPSTALPSNVNIVMVVAASAGGVVCLVGFILFALVIYKTKRKSRIAAKRKSVYSTSGEFEMFTRYPSKINGSFRLVE